MRQRCLLPLLFLSLLSAFSCSKKTDQNQAAAASQAAGEEIDPYQNLVFTFEEPVVPASQVNHWDTTRYVAFEPAIKGKFKWANDGRELVFSPLEPFRPSTAFAASLRTAALPSGKQKLTLSRPKFHTPFLDLSGAQVFFGRSNRAAGTAELRANVQFNYPVRPADLRPLLRVSQNGHPIAFTLTAAEPDRTLAIAINQDVKPGQPLHFEVLPGLQAVAGSQATTQPLLADSEVPDQQTLQVRELTGQILDGKAVVTLLTNQPVSVADIQPLLKVTPAVPYEVEALESGLALRGGFEVGKTYQVRIDPGLRGTLGGQLAEKFDQGVSFGDSQPSISFASTDKAMYLNALGNRNLGLRLNEVANVKVTVAKVYASNIQEILRTDKQYGYEPNEDGEPEQDENGDYVDRSYQYYDLENRGDVLFTRTYATTGLAKENGLRLLPLNLKDLEFNAPLKGLYVVRVQDTERQWLRQDKLVALTDLGLIAKQGVGGGTVVFLNSLRTARPVSGATVRFISTNNQLMGTAITNGQGVARFDSVAGSPLRLGMVLATRDADFTFLSLKGSRVETSRFEVGGLTSNAAHYQAFLYGDRDLYRPGDTIHTNVVVRTEDWHTPPAGLPVKVRLLLPTGKEYASFGEKLSATGAVESRFILPPTVMTGLYELEVLTGNDVLLTSKAVSVEEFIPDRLKVTVTAAPTVLRPAQTVTATIAAQNLFGPPAAGRKFEVEFSLKEKKFSAKNYPEYNFDINTGERPSRSTTEGEEGSEEPSSGIAQRFQKSVSQGATDAAGRGTATYVLPDARDLGTLEGVAFATVFDETGRPVNRLATFEVQTQATLFGIAKVPELVSTRQALPLKLLALTPGGQPARATAQVRIVRLLWETVLERQGGRYIYNSQKREQVLSSQTQSVGVGTSFTFTPTYSGEYEVRVSRPGAASYVAAHFYAYGSGDTAGNSFEVNTEGEVTIEADKPKYEPGQTAQLLLKTPFPGRILVTVERDRVFDHFYVDTDQKSARVSIPIRTGHVPNVYVTATAIRPITDNSLPLTVARGFVPLTVEKPGAHLAVSIKAPELSRSQVFQTVEVHTAPRAQVTLAVVDEGILQRKNYHTPDPYGYFYQKRALEVNAFDVYPFLLPEMGTSSSGGDAADLARRTTPVPSRRVKLVAKWSGILTADASGVVRYKVRVPQFSGALRVMAVAYKDDAFGNAEQTMRVADPVVISTALPRFMSPGDTIDVPVTLTNTTKDRIFVKVTKQLTGPLISAEPITENGVDGISMKGRNEEWTVPLLPNKESRITFHIGARQTIGNGSVKIVAVGLKGSTETFSELIEIPIRPAAPLEKRTGNGEVAAGTPAVLNLRTDFLPSSLRSKLVLSRSPLIQFSKDLSYLLQYPYGCLEQTVSAAFPQLYFGDLAATLQQKPGGRAQRYNPNYNVQEAIRKIEAMQLYNGSLSYWPGGDYDNWWATAYAAHFLLEAKQAGFAVNQSTLDKVLHYLQFRLKKRETEPYQYFTVDGLARQRIIAKREITYSLYVLALAGRQDAVALNYYKANRPLLTLEARFLLACTYALGGQQRAFQEVLPRQFSAEKSGRELGDSFASPIRDEALALNALLEADPTNPQVNAIARQLSRQVRTARYLNTQERAFALLALGKIARRSQASTTTATLLADGKEIGKFSGKDLTVNNVANRQLTIKASGAGPLYYYWEEEGISAGGRVREEDSYLKVRRAFATRDGRPMTQGTFQQNDLVMVVISLQSADAAGEVKNVAITDLLPAGLEIENPRLTPSRDMTNFPGLAQPDYLDVRDDRINLFTTATPKPKYFMYLARAVSKGTFKLGPVSADAMYNAEYHSYNGAGVVRVK
ncbi:alpha-2-macroglobulin family protein [Hymenobacter sp. HMF4947]|uniref:Alpha-2-macroglobulin family protein n=1 Tax=Hymenobacter ginkgonis TaxID=2682976 RepID=A0A7K1THQ7_9BACT|nr:MG2 domain-containing protein [Hymenobacter ginkgonis]MVN77934.1 alpha-2-macroglobulin family protein [Hymenobacter ginkgonis]